MTYKDLEEELRDYEQALETDLVALLDACRWVEKDRYNINQIKQRIKEYELQDKMVRTENR